MQIKCSLRKLCSLSSINQDSTENQVNHSAPGHTGESSDPYIHGEQSTCSPFHDQETVSNPDQIVSQPPLTPPTGRVFLYIITLKVN